MTLDEIEKSLPNGFHDASLSMLNIDYEKRKAWIELSVDVEEPHAQGGELKNLTRKGILTLTGLVYCVLGPPDSGVFCPPTGSPWITDTGSVNKSKISMKLPEPLPTGIFSYYFFIRDWNTFIIVAAADAQFDWDPGSVDPAR